ncbi:MAG TPA: GvpL/GvpF family gas vesicle protein [Candidatus Limnocylindria bacterium]|nr:GvpL/GvpF family gas vesicle protein [Candidatus Limnocylindria bacterium]
MVRRDIYEALQDSVIASRSNKVIGDRMIMNGAFLVARDKANLFDRKVQEKLERGAGSRA